VVPPLPTSHNIRLDGGKVWYGIVETNKETFDHSTS